MDLEGWDDGVVDGGGGAVVAAFFVVRGVAGVGTGFGVGVAGQCRATWQWWGSQEDRGAPRAGASEAVDLEVHVGTPCLARKLTETVGVLPFLSGEPTGGARNLVRRAWKEAGSDGRALPVIFDVVLVKRG